MSGTPPDFGVLTLNLSEDLTLAPGVDGPRVEGTGVEVRKETDFERLWAEGFR